MNRPVVVGVLAGLTTGALWGLTFVAPRAVQPFTEFDFAVARYLIFGVASLLLCAHPSFRPVNVRMNDMLAAMLLGSAGYIGYFLCAAFAVRYAGAAIPPLIVGLLPVVLAIIGNARDRTLTFQDLLVPLALITLGVVIVNGGTLAVEERAGDRTAVVAGVGFSVLALLIWVVYGVLNAQIMRRPSAPPALVWAGLQGIGAGLGTLPLAGLLAIFGGSALPATPLLSPGGLSFLAWALVMGLAGSWLATWCWSVASARLPLALAAQLIVAETIFGLAYGFAYEVRWPTSFEALGGALQILGVVMSVHAFHKKRLPQSARFEAAEARSSK